MPVIEVEHLTKEYRLGALQGLKQTLLNTGRRLVGKSVPERPLFKALDDVSFSIEQGEVVGIIGHNGAGKSTLLKMLARISTPTHGSVKVTGRIAPLIEVGAGFVPDFTGRENVYLNGAILGMSRQEIDRKFDEIVDFAEMKDFIDTPVKRYSSGMQVKLAFAVATSIESEILIVDEVLAVGDLAFQRKCFDRMEDLIKRQNKTVLLVSHNIRQVERLCTRVILLDHGKILRDSSPNEVCALFYERSDEQIKALAVKNLQSTAGRQKSSGEVENVAVSLIDPGAKKTDRVDHGSNATVLIQFTARTNLRHLTFGLGVHTTDFIYLTTHNSEQQIHVEELQPGAYEIRCRISDFPLLPGVYSLRLGITEGAAARTIFYSDNVQHFHVRDTQSLTSANRDGFFPLRAQWSQPVHNDQIEQMEQPD